MIYLVVKILLCDLGSGGSSGQPGIAEWPVGRPAYCVLWPAGGGAEVGAGWPGAPPAAAGSRRGRQQEGRVICRLQWRHSLQSALPITTQYINHGSSSAQTPAPWLQAKVCRAESAVPKSEFGCELCDLGQMILTSWALVFEVCDTCTPEGYC